jgi:hypothetical protein
MAPFAHAELFASPDARACEHRTLQNSAPNISADAHA